jgi:hypothetical protein
MIAGEAELNDSALWRLGELDPCRVMFKQLASEW